jgi:hypothetical protein
MFLKNILPPSSGLKSKPSKTQAERDTGSTSGLWLLLAGYLLDLSLSLKMAAVQSSETSVNFYQTTQRHIPEGGPFYDHCLSVSQVNVCFCIFFFDQ